MSKLDSDFINVASVIAIIFACAIVLYLIYNLVFMCRNKRQNRVHILNTMTPNTLINVVSV
jgi:hypothetical protein